ncbi:hypothetical protein [Photobacterium ganghwense]|uniref:hypothetical protein n=1 Tax=Photobacterium ganghwense TaxID=320778 RepID=UPI001A8E64DB|nr:hypothetical protein [Photobacterium ganghwense]QSV17163.1 hypothetical protein FH974_19690 [Photobacterium ganghwense]
MAKSTVSYIANAETVNVKSKADAVQNVKNIQAVIDSKVEELEKALAETNDKQREKDLTATIRTEKKRARYVSQFLAMVENDQKAASANYQMQKENQLNLADICGDMYSLEKLAFIFGQKNFEYTVARSTETNVIIPFKLIEEMGTYSFTVKQFREFYSDVKVEAWRKANPELCEVELNAKREKTNRQSQMILSMLVKLGAFEVTSKAKLSNDSGTVQLAENSKLLQLLSSKFESLSVFVNAQ